ncbi:hypothetical protein Cni_G04830 [Canna indica]|uniref:Uncharacterized protein n=1 Tax=Canna indica TaxID=4628 RepID=A0AAQ3JTF8_9LILI|nr:hypothetical protein Cni_G04830 [Canna indica]
MHRPRLHSTFLPLLLLLLNCSCSCSSSATEKPTAYEALQSYGFPVGLLPKGVLDYDLDESTGAFAAYLDGSCSFSLEGSYQLKYSSTISGRISTGLLTSLKGVSVKVLFFWLNIIEVRLLDDSLRFSVGIASADFALNNFYISPQCGCGLDCPDDDDVVTRSPLRLPGRHPGALDRS